MTDTTFEIGDWARSKKVGSKKSFVGQITEKLGDDFILRDAERRRWLRTHAELVPAKAKRNPKGNE